jgi:hypothetical protein
MWELSMDIIRDITGLSPEILANLSAEQALLLTGEPVPPGVQFQTAGRLHGNDSSRIWR